MFTKTYIKDVAERVVRTFGVAFLTALLTGGVFDLSTTKAAALSGLTAVGTFLLALLTKPVGNSDTASVFKGE